MSTPIILKLTKAGLAASYNARLRGISIELDKMKFSTDRFLSVPNDDRTDLENVVCESLISSGGVSLDYSTLRFKTVIITGAEVSIGSAGVYTAEGVLFAIASVEENELFKVYPGISFAASFGMALAHAILEKINIVTDDNAALALAIMSDHENSTDPHPQYANGLAEHQEQIDQLEDYIKLVESKLILASTTLPGMVKLNDTLTSNAVDEALTARQGKILRNMIPGAGGKWQDVIRIRPVYENIRNDTGRLLYVTMCVHFPAGTQHAFNIYVDDELLNSIYATHTKGTLYAHIPYTFFVPPGSTYRLEHQGNYLTLLKEL